MNALGRHQAHGAGQRRRDKAGQLAVGRAGAGHVVVHAAQIGAQRLHARHHAVEHRGKAVYVGVFAVKLGHGILLGRGIAVCQLAFNFAARRAQALRGKAGQLGALRRNPDGVRADAAVQKAHAVHGVHAVHHGAQQHKRLLLRQGLFPAGKVARKRRALVRLAHGIGRVVRLHHVQHRHKALGAAKAHQAAVKVGKIHAGGFKQHLAPGARQHAAVCGARGANRDGHILLNGDAAHLFAVNGAVSNALAVQAKAFAYGVAPCKQRVRRQRAGGVGVHKALAAVRAALRAKLYIGHAVVADDLLGHRPSPLLF